MIDKNKHKDNRNRSQELSKTLCERVQLKRVQILSAEVINFDSLPDSAHIRLSVMKILYSCSSSTIWRGVKSGLIPAPHHLATKITCWQVGKVRAALAKHNK